MLPFKRRPKSESSNADNASSSRWGIFKYFKRPENMPPVSNELAQDFFFYALWFIAPIQQTPIFLGFIALLMVFSWSHRIRDGQFVRLNQLWPEEGRWIAPLIALSLFLLSSIIWTPVRYHTLQAWLYGVWTPVLILLMQYHFIQNLNHWRKVLTFFLAHLMFIFSGVMLSQGIDMHPDVSRYDWSSNYFTPQAASVWLLIIFPVFMGLIWHQDRQYRRFAAIGIGVIGFIALIVAKLGLWIGLFLCTAVILASFAWTGRCHFVFSDFMYTHRSGFKIGGCILGVSGIEILYGLYKNRAVELTSSWGAFLALPNPGFQTVISGHGLGNEVVGTLYKHIANLHELPWLVNWFFQVGGLGIVLALWLWLAMAIGFISDLYSSRADRQWVGVIGMGLIVSLTVSSFFSNIELGTIMIPASLVLATLYGLKRFLETMYK